MPRHAPSLHGTRAVLWGTLCVAAHTRRMCFGARAGVRLAPATGTAVHCGGCAGANAPFTAASLKVGWEGGHVACAMYC